MLWDPWDPLARHQYVYKWQTNNNKSVQLDWCTDAYQGAFRVCLIYRKLLLLLRSSGTVASFTFGAPPWKLNPVCWVPWQVEMGPGMSSQKWCKMQGFQCDRHDRRTRWPTCNHSVKELVEDARAWPVQGDFKRLIIGWLISISVSMVTNTYKYYRKLNLGQIRYSFKNRNKKVDPGETTEVLNEEPGSSTLWKKTIFQICEVLEGLGRTHCEEYSNQPLQVCFITFLDVNNLTASKHHRPKVWAPGKWCWMIPWSSIRALFRSSWHFQETCRKHQSHQAKKWHEIVDQICIKHFWKGVAPLFPHPQAKHNPFFPMAHDPHSSSGTPTCIFATTSPCLEEALFGAWEMFLVHVSDSLKEHTMHEAFPSLLS